MIEYNKNRFAEALPLLLKARDGVRAAHTPGDAISISTSPTRSPGSSVTRKPSRTSCRRLRFYPQNMRARAGLAMLYQSMGRREMPSA